MAKEQGRKLIAQNKKARHDYHIEDTYEAGLVLMGTEVKSLRMGRASLADGFVDIDEPRGVAARRPHPGVHPGHLDQPRRPAQAQAAAEPPRDRQDRAPGQREGAHASSRWRSTSWTAGPRSRSPSRKGKKSWDKRHSLAERQANREKEQALGRRLKGMRDVTPSRRRTSARAVLAVARAPGALRRPRPLPAARTSSDGSTSSSTRPGRRSAGSGRSATAAPHEERVEQLRGLGVRRFPRCPTPTGPASRPTSTTGRATSPATCPSALWSATFYPEPEARGVRRGAARRRGRGVQDPRAGGGVRPRRPAARRGVGAARGRRHAGRDPRRLAARSATSSPGPSRCAGVLDRHPAAAAVDRPHGRAGVRRVPRPRRALRAGPPRHHDGVHRLLRRRGAVPARPAAAAAPTSRPKVLLGSDFPNIPYPYAHQLEALAAARPRRRLAARGLLGQRRCGSSAVTRPAGNEFESWSAFTRRLNAQLKRG